MNSSPGDDPRRNQGDVEQYKKKSVWGGAKLNCGSENIECWTALLSNSSALEGL